MGSVPKYHLGVASGILASMRNVGMVLGIATGGAVLYTFASPQVLQRTALNSMETSAFLSGLKYAYMAGEILCACASCTSLVRHKEVKTEKELT
jgi:hypothetical protein